MCVLDGSGGGELRTLFKTQFAFVTDQKQYMAELLLGSVAETEGGAYPIFPPLPSNQALREYDQSLTDALMDSDLPAGWTLVGYNNPKTINSIPGNVCMCVHVCECITVKVVYMRCIYSNLSFSINFVP